MQRILRFNAFSLVHLHDPGELQAAGEVTRGMVLPLVFTLHNFPQTRNAVKKLYTSRLSGLITTDYYYYRELGSPGFPFWFIPEGINLQYCRQYSPSKYRYRVLFVGEQGGYDPYALECLCKASDLSREKLNILAPQKPVTLEGRYLGLQMDPVPYLQNASIAVTSGRAAAEAMSCGCIPVVLGYKYAGIPGTGKAGQEPFPDLSGTKGRDPCYKDLFYDLNELMENSGKQEKLQKWAADFASKNFDLNLVAEKTTQFYRSVLGQKGCQ